MAYLFSQLINPVSQWRGVVERQIEMFRRIAHTILWPGERCEIRLDRDGLGVWIGVAAPWRNPEAVFKTIKKEAFPSFGFLGVHLNDGLYWTHFRALVV
jgi:hypothetical protein